MAYGEPSISLWDYETVMGRLCVLGNNAQPFINRCVPPSEKDYWDSKDEIQSFRLGYEAHPMGEYISRYFNPWFRECGKEVDWSCSIITKAFYHKKMEIVNVKLHHIYILDKKDYKVKYNFGKMFICKDPTLFANVILHSDFWWLNKEKEIDRVREMFLSSGWNVVEENMIIENKYLQSPNLSQICYEKIWEIYDSLQPLIKNLPKPLFKNFEKITKFLDAKAIYESMPK